jgi:hypothetical protein
MSFLFGLGKSPNFMNPVFYEANQRGQIPPEQADLVSKTWLLGINWSQIIAGVVIVPIICGFTVTFGIMLELFLGFLVAGLLVLALIVAGGVGLYRAIYHNAQIKQDLENRNIRQGQALLTFEKGRYALDCQGRLIGLPAMGDTGGLVPGTRYAIYYLENSGTLLSVGESFPPSPSQVQNAMTEILGKVLGFDSEDLSANRQHEVTSRQRGKLVWNLLGGLVMVGLGAGFVGPFLLMDIREDLFFLAIIAIPLLLFLVFGGFMIRNAVVDMFVSAPQTMEGVGQKISRVKGSGKNRRTHYYYVFGQEALEVPRKAFDAFIPGLEYRAHYLPRTKKLISIECIDRDARIEGV